VNTVRIEIDNKKIERRIAANWNEFTRKQLLFVVRSLFLKTTLSRKTEMILVKLLNIKWKYIKLLNHSQINALGDSVKFIFNSNNFTKNTFDTFTYKFKRYHSPGEGLNNITFEELTFADNMFLQYHKTRKQEFLDKLIAILYRPRKKRKEIRHIEFNGDVRIDFNKHQIEKRALHLKKLPAHYKFIGLTFFTGCRNLIEKKFPHVFSSGSASGSKKTGWLDVILGLAGNKFGDFEKTSKMNAWVVLREFENMIIENEKLKDKFNRK